MSGEMIDVTDADFAREVLQAAEPVLVDFGAEWCAPCKAIEPSLKTVASRYAGRVKVAYVDVDQAQQTAEQYGIRSMPTLLVFRGGRVVAQLVGAAPLARIEETLKRAIA